MYFQYTKKKFDIVYMNIIYSITEDDNYYYFLGKIDHLDKDAMIIICDKVNNTVYECIQFRFSDCFNSIVLTNNHKINLGSDLDGKQCDYSRHSENNKINVSHVLLREYDNLSYDDDSQYMVIGILIF